ncbi:MAG: hypothetical protein QN178_08165 [Armatimonadota bacterium]|nr:hypothetical protein [Armatimonadota bacterium]
MRSLRWGAFVIAALVLVSAAPAALAWAPIRLPVVQRNNNFCFDRDIRIGNIVISGNRCYNTYLVNTANGVFLGLGPGGAPLVAPGQLGRLNYVPGSAPSSPMLYMLRLNTLVNLPVNAYRLVVPQFLLQNNRLVINVPVAQGRTAVLQSDERMPGEQDK